MFTSEMLVAMKVFISAAISPCLGSPQSSEMVFEIKGRSSMFSFMSIDLHF
jgi:hypothetical protein